ncbi:MAG: ClpXP protease specificity-enhancing factor [Bordetella sp.]|jgi:stringent starvation protein B
MTSSSGDVASTKPYLVRAIYEWCSDQGFTPYLAVSVNEETRVPLAHVRNGEIVLNISPLATHQLVISNEDVRFSARFSGVVENLKVPISQIAAIYAKETGHGMAFDVSKPLGLATEPQAHGTDDEDPPPTSPSGLAGVESSPGQKLKAVRSNKVSGKPSLRRVK